MRKNGEKQFAEEGVNQGAGDVAFDLGAGVFDELVVLDSRGAGGDAGHAAETVVDVLAEVLAEGSFARRGLVHHVDAAARGVHLFAPQDVGGASGKAKAAVDAGIDDLLLWRVVTVEGGRLRGCGDLDVRHLV